MARRLVRSVFITLATAPASGVIAGAFDLHTQNLRSYACPGFSLSVGTGVACTGRRVQAWSELLSRLPWR